MFGRAQRRLGQPLRPPLVDVGEGIGHADVVVGGVLEVIGETELEVEVARPPVLLAGIHQQHVFPVTLLHLVGDAIEGLQRVEAANARFQTLVGLHLVRPHFQHGAHRLVGEARLVDDLHLVDKVGGLTATLGTAAQLLVAIGVVLRLGERQFIELQRHLVSRRLTDLDPLRHPGKVGDPHIAKLGCDQYVFRPHQRLLLVGTNLGHIGGELVNHGQP